MLPEQIRDASTIVATALAAQPELEDALLLRWRAGLLQKKVSKRDSGLPDEVCTAADFLGGALPDLTHSPTAVSDLSELFGTPAGEILVLWCSASTWRR